MKSNKRRTWLSSSGGGSLVLLVVLSLLIAACGATSDPTDTTSETSDSTGSTSGTDETTAPSDEPVELLVWAARPYYIPVDEFAACMEKYPNLDITFDVRSDDDQLQQIQVMQDAGQKLPDLVQDDAYLFEVYQAGGIFQSLEEISAQFAEEDPELYDKLLSSAWEGTVIDGETYGMAPFTTFDQFFYNVPWFEEAGVDLPFESLEEVFEAAMAMKAARPDSIPMSVQALAGEGVTALKAMFNAAGVPFDGSTPDLTSEQGLYVLDWYLRMQQNGLLPADAIAWGESESRAPFLIGDAGLMVDSLSTAFDYIEAEGFDYEEDWALALIPTSMTGESQDGAWTANPVKTWGVTAETEHPYEAGLVLRCLADTETLVQQTLNGAPPPRQTEALQDERIQEVMPFLTDELKDALVNAAAPAISANAGDVEAILEQLFGEIVSGTDLTAQELADKYQAQLDEL